MEKKDSAAKLTVAEALAPARLAAIARAAVAAHPVTTMVAELEAKVEGMEPGPDAADPSRSGGELE